MKFLNEAGERALEKAIVALEAVSSVEVVIAIRRRARYALTQHATVGLVTAIAVLAFTLYSNVEFALWHILTLPILAGLMGAMLVEALPPLYRFLAPPWLRYDHVREAAYAAFLERNVHSTRDRTGLLVYIAERERMVELVGDLAVVDKLGIETLAAWAGELEAAIPKGGEAFAKQLEAFAPALSELLPRRTDDIDELSNEVQVFGRPPRQRRTAMR
jgi:putative membrane protein